MYPYVIVLVFTIMMKVETGFTLVELMVTLIVSSILLAVGVPSFVGMIRNNRTATMANEMVATLNLARSEAVKRGLQVTVRPTGAQWEGGWSIFTDINRNGAFNDNADGVLCETGEDCELRRYEALANGFTLRTGANFANWVAYLPTGRSQSGGLPNDTFRLCADDQVTAEGRSIIVSVGGRIRLEKGVTECP